jgi:hypothetical protein
MRGEIQKKLFVSALLQRPCCTKGFTPRARRSAGTGKKNSLPSAAASKQSAKSVEGPLLPGLELTLYLRGDTEPNPLFGNDFSQPTRPAAQKQR